MSSIKIHVNIVCKFLFGLLAGGLEESHPPIGGLCRGLLTVAWPDKGIRSTHLILGRRDCTKNRNLGTSDEGSPPYVFGST
jgi:hypothetical protein